MKFIRTYMLFFILFLTNIIKAQTTSEALEFLKINIPIWACEEFVEGTFKKRLEISLLNNEKTLQLLVNQPLSFGTETYMICQIDFSAITEIYLQNNTDCQGVVIKTKPNGLHMVAYYSNGQIIPNYDFDHWNRFFEKNGWMDDNIRILRTADNSNGGKRIIKALVFLANKNGAILENSHF